MSSTAADQVLAEAAIPGLDIPEALARMGNNPKLYMRIIRSFVANMPANLESLATSTISGETLEAYSIKIHGAKGSCYGIGANAVGDIARDLEIAAKNGDLASCQRDNDTFILATQELLKELIALEEKIEELENSAGGKVQADKPDAQKLKALLYATQSFSITEMSNLVEELTSTQYLQGSEAIMKIKTAFEAFDYQTIEETITEYLAQYSARGTN
ncbi:MAG: hypothetical protein FWE41_05685 [Coriobacteriia bacterium]|nr:hypothetical protein [Coriobacteriia bacterium]MCL2750192.1 hypothetical protein [Coriobacteriia bacterium]